MIHRQPSKERGVSLIEMLIYTAILILIVMAVGSTVLAFSRVYRSIIAEQKVEEAGHVAMERIMREIKKGSSIDSAGSSFASATGALALNTTDDGGDPIIVRFFLSDSNMHVSEDGEDIGPLLPQGASVTRFYLTSITTAISRAVKVELTVESGTSTSYRSKNFYGTAVLRGSYLDQ
ncbi:hypothetical protein C4568_04195 [Candidatus Parcubacteria bacterium]|nr:MAG: hypothetical protein C4568_04195 [Candidatus Parcubacteria bacterium]